MSKRSGPGEDQLDTLIEAVYQAAADPALWPRFLRMLADTLHAPSAVLFIHDFEANLARPDASGVLFRTTGIDDAFVDSYGRHFGSVNVWAANEAHLGTGDVVTSEMLCAPSSLQRSEFYGDWLRPQGLSHALGGVVERSGSRAAKLSVMRGPQRQAFGDVDLQFMRRLYPHVRRACALHARLAHAEADAALGRLALQAAPLGVFALTAAGDLLHANAMGQRWLANNDAVHVLRGRLLARDPNRQSALRAAIAQTLARRTPSHVALASPSDPGRSLTLMRMPPGDRFALHGGRAELLALVGTGAARTQPSPAQLATLFGLSPAEAQVALALAEGESLQTLQALRGVSRNTLRTQLQSALGKTGCDSQRALVRLVLGLPAWPPAD